MKSENHVTDSFLYTELFSIHYLNVFEEHIFIATTSIKLVVLYYLPHEVT